MGKSKAVNCFGGASQPGQQRRGLDRLIQLSSPPASETPVETVKALRLPQTTHLTTDPIFKDMSFNPDITFANPVNF